MPMAAKWLYPGRGLSPSAIFILASQDSLYLVGLSLSLPVPLCGDLPIHRSLTLKRGDRGATGRVGGRMGVKMPGV